MTQSHREPICSPQGERKVHGGRERHATTEKNDKITTEMYDGMFRNVKSLKMISTLADSWVT